MFDTIPMTFKTLVVFFVTTCRVEFEQICYFLPKLLQNSACGSNGGLLILGAILECFFPNQNLNYVVASKYDLTSQLKDFIHIQNYSLMFETILEVGSTPHHYCLSQLSHRQEAKASCLMGSVVEEL